MVKDKLQHTKSVTLFVPVIPTSKNAGNNFLDGEN